MNKPRRDIRPDAQGFDEVRLITVPRYKESGMSGDEWRISIKAQYWRKGELKFEETVASNMESACSFMGYKYTVACEGSFQFYGGEKDYCDQEGCSKKATVTYSKKHSFCRDGHKTENTDTVIRLFCDDHKTRGDCGLDDADCNYQSYQLNT